MRCVAITKENKRCKNHAQHGKKLCYPHSKKDCPPVSKKLVRNYQMMVDLFNRVQQLPLEAHDMNQIAAWKTALDNSFVSGEYMDVEREFEDFRSQLSKQLSQTRQVVSADTTKNNRLSERIGELEALVASCDKLKEELKTKSSELAKKSSRIGSLEADLAEKMRQIEALEKSRPNADKTIDDMKETIAALEARIERANQNMFTRAADLGEKDKNITELEGKLRACEKESKDLTSMLKVTRTGNEALKEKIDTLNVERDVLKDEIKKNKEKFVEDAAKFARIKQVTDKLIENRKKFREQMSKLPTEAKFTEMKAQLENLERDVMEKQGVIDRLQNEFKKQYGLKDAQIATKSRDAQEAKREMLTLQRQLNAVKDQFGDDGENYMYRITQLKDFYATRQSIERKMRKMEMDLTERNATIESQARELEQKQQELFRTNQEVKDCETRINGALMEAEAQKLKNALTEARAENAVLQTRAKEVATEMKKVRDQRRSLEVQLNRDQQELIRARTNLKNANGTQNDLSACEKNLRDTQGELEDVKVKLRRLESEKQGLVAQMAVEKESVQKLTRDIQLSKKEFAKLKANQKTNTERMKLDQYEDLFRNQKTQQDIEELKTWREQQSTLQNEVSKLKISLRQTIQGKDDDIEAAKKDYRDCDAKFRAREKLISSLQTQKEQTEEELEAARTELDGYKEDLATLKASRSNDEKSREKLQNTIRELRAEITSLEKDLGTVESNLRTAAEVGTELSEQREKLEKQIARYQDEYLNLKNSNQALTLEKAACETKTRNLTSQLEDASQIKNKAEQCAVDLNQALADKRVIQEQLNQSAKDAAVIETLRSDVEKLRNERVSLKAALKSCENTSSLSDEREKALTEELKTNQRQVDALKREINAFDENVIKLTNANETKKSEIDALSAQMETLRNELSSREINVTQLESKNKSLNSENERISAEAATLVAQIKDMQLKCQTEQALRDREIEQLKERLNAVARPEEKSRRTTRSQTASLSLEQRIVRDFNTLKEQMEPADAIVLAYQNQTGINDESKNNALRETILKNGLSIRRLRNIIK